ncbi:MAG TPA: PP2C family serine/threonine-protein phosphatase [Actinoplanes sp.]|nr:PP2C family serine/threonine-protein phosphatase [Actinoplanes sp.]
MTSTKLTAQVFGRSVRGASHVRTDMTNQDAMAWSPASGRGDAVVVAVADGHGSPKSLRSDHGSRLAVRIATAVLEALLPELRRPVPREAALGRLAEAARAITDRWVREVRAELDSRPFSGDELSALDPRERRDLGANPLLAYGTTLLAAVATASGVYYLQLGDGDIVFVARDGSAWVPLPEDRRNAGNETLSLCLPDAARDFRLGVAEIEQAPRMILLSSDGFANSYQNESAFLKFGSDLSRMIEESGVPAIEERLEGWLQETTEHGAGDDVTLTIVVLALPPGVGRAAAPAPPPAAEPSRAPTRRGRASVATAAPAPSTQRTPPRMAPRTPPPAMPPPASVPAREWIAPGGRPSRRSRLLAGSMLGGAAALILLILAFSLINGDEPGDENRPPAGAPTQAAPAQPEQPKPSQAPLVPAREVVQCGTAFCVLDNEGFLWFVNPGADWQRQDLAGGGWTHMSVVGADVILTGDRASTRLPAPANGQIPPSDVQPPVFPTGPPNTVPPPNRLDQPNRNDRQIDWSSR